MLRRVENPPKLPTRLRDSCLIGKTVSFNFTGVGGGLPPFALDLHHVRGLYPWNFLTTLARTLKTNIYVLKKGLLSDYMKGELKNPSIRMASV
jgi:hypothetical protein